MITYNIVHMFYILDLIIYYSKFLNSIQNQWTLYIVVT